MEQDNLKILLETEQRSKSNSHRLDEVEEEVKENRELTVAVKEIATEMKHLREEQTDMNKRLKIIEEKPLKEYEDTKKKVKEKALMFILGIIFTYIALKLRIRKFYIRRKETWTIFQY